jgi:two-component system, chemotaxis family, chemotaxis protein CheY
MLTTPAAAAAAALPTRKGARAVMQRAALPPSAHLPPAGFVMPSQQSKKDDAEHLTDDVSVVPARLSKKELADRIQALCVLVVDDNQYMRKMVRNLLVNCGIKDIYEAGDGITALDTIRTVGPDVVVLDWEMPLLSGAELVRIVRSPGVFPMPDIPIIMLSGHGERWRVVEAARLGVNEYLVKPVSAKSLYDRLVAITLQPRPTVQLGDYYGPEPRKLAGEAVDDANLATSLVPPLVV